MPLRLLAAILALSAAALSLTWPSNHQKAQIRAVSAPRSDSAVSGVGLPPEIGTAQFLAYTEGVAVRAYLDALEAARLEAERAAAEAAAREAAAAARQSVTPARSSPTVSGDCAPVAAIIGWGIVNRESGGNPSAANPSGAYGCSQTLLSHYYGGVCSGLDPYTVAGQAACTQILYDRGGLNPWAQTR